MENQKKHGSPSGGHYEFIEHTADIAIKAFGETLSDAYATAASAMFDIITDGSDIGAAEKIEFETESIDLPGLLVGFLSDLIVLHETEDLVFANFKVEFAENSRLKVTAWGEPFDENRHARGHHVKGVSYHMMEIHDGGDKEQSYVQVLFDV